MPVAEATALAGRGASGGPFGLDRYDPAAARAALVAVATWCERYSPVVGLEERERPESLLLDVTGLGPSVRRRAGIDRPRRRELAAQGWQVRLALADTVVRPGPWPITQSANSESGPLIVPPGDSLAAVARLPIPALRLDDQTVQLLTALGLEQIGQLKAFARPSLATRFRPGLAAPLGSTLRYGRGNDPRRKLDPAARSPLVVPVPHRPRRSCRSGHRAAVGAINRVARQPAAGRAATLLPVAGATASSTVQFSVGLFRPSASAKYLLALARLRLERLKLPGPVNEIHLAVTMTELLGLPAKPLFASSLRRDDPGELALLVDRLSSRLWTALRVAGLFCLTTPSPSALAATNRWSIGRASHRTGAARKKKPTACCSKLSPRRPGEPRESTTSGASAGASPLRGGRAGRCRCR